MRHLKSMCICVHPMCVCVTDKKNRQLVEALVERLGGVNSREADGAEGRRLMQQRARGRKKEKEDLAQIGWMSVVWVCVRGRGWSW